MNQICVCIPANVEAERPCVLGRPATNIQDARVSGIQRPSKIMACVPNVLPLSRGAWVLPSGTAAPQGAVGCSGLLGTYLQVHASRNRTTLSMSCGQGAWYPHAIV